MLATSGEHLSTQIWEIKTLNKLQTFQEDRMNIYIYPTPHSAVTFTPDDQYVITGAGDGDINAWDLTTGKGTMIIDIHSWVHYITCFSDRKRILANSTVFLFPDGNLVAEFNGLSYLTNDGLKILEWTSFLQDNIDYLRMNIWDAKTYEKVGETPGFRTKSQVMRITPDGNYIVIGRINDSEPTRIMNVQNTNQVSVLDHNDFPVRKIEFSPDGKRMALVSTNTVYIYDISGLTAGVKGSENMRP
ncbi:MAG: WD40 repeat domain-containing protein [bacterium]